MNALYAMLLAFGLAGGAVATAYVLAERQPTEEETRFSPEELAYLAAVEEHRQAQEAAGGPTPRSDCDQMRGTEYAAEGEREWFLEHCVTPAPPAESGPPPDPGQVTLDDCLRLREATDRQTMYQVPDECVYLILKEESCSSVYELVSEEVVISTRAIKPGERITHDAVAFGDGFVGCPHTDFIIAAYELEHVLGAPALTEIPPGRPLYLGAFCPRNPGDVFMDWGGSDEPICQEWYEERGIQ